MKSNWNYRVIDMGEYFQIREVFYKNSSPVIAGSQAIPLIGDTLKDLKEILKLYLKALDKSVLKSCLMTQISRQRTKQLRWKDEGRCQICGKPAVPKSNGRFYATCLEHLLKKKEYARKKYGWKRIYKKCERSPIVID